jgi:PEP-CTERM motif
MATNINNLIGSRSKLQHAFRSTLLAFGIFMVALAPARAVVVNIDALTNNSITPINVFLAAGTYNVTPIAPPTSGAVYTAWNAWGNTEGCNTEGICSVHGWLNAYVIADTGTGDLPAIKIQSGQAYETAGLAFANALGYQFTLPIAQTLSFYIDDDILSDNLGGISLAVNPTPLPGTLPLFATGLGVFGLLGWRRNRKKTVAAAI